MELLRLGFSQAEIISGKYLQYRILNAGMEKWKTIEQNIKPFRGSQFFTFTTWLLYTQKQQSL